MLNIGSHVNENEKKKIVKIKKSEILLNGNNALEIGWIATSPKVCQKICH